MTLGGNLERVWPHMCAVYRDPALAQVCLAVQDAYNVDVPLLLVLCLADRQGHGLAQADLATLIRSAGDWREATIRPLRQARQAMKGRFVADPELALRDAIKRLELEAERLHVARLVNAYPTSSRGSAGAPAYLAECGTPERAAQEFLRTFAAAYSAQVLAHTDDEI